MNVFNEFSCSMNNRANVYVTVMFKLYSITKFFPVPHRITLKVTEDTTSWDKTQAHHKIFK